VALPEHARTPECRVVRPLPPSAESGAYQFLPATWRAPEPPGHSGFGPATRISRPRFVERRGALGSDDRACFAIAPRQTSREWPPSLDGQRSQRLRAAAKTASTPALFHQRSWKPGRPVPAWRLARDNHLGPWASVADIKVRLGMQQPRISAADRFAALIVAGRRFKMASLIVNPPTVSRPKATVFSRGWCSLSACSRRAHQRQRMVACSPSRAEEKDQPSADSIRTSPT